MASRDARGRLLPGHSARTGTGRLGTDYTVIGVRVTGREAELAHAAARHLDTTVSELLRLFLRGLIRADANAKR